MQLYNQIETAKEDTEKAINNAKTEEINQLKKFEKAQTL